MSSFRNLFLKVSTKEQILFARNLSLMSKSGMPIIEALKMISQQTQSGSLRRILKSVIQDVENGQFLSTSLEKYEGVFGTLFINIVEVGETAGTLPENLGFLAEELKKKQELKGKIVNALIYPAIIIVTTLGLVGLLSFFVFPKILPIFSSLRVQLPLSTRIVIAANAFITHNWLEILGGLVIVWFGMVGLLRLPPVRYGYDRFMLLLPVVGTMNKNIQMTVLARTLGLLLKSGVKIVEALSITSDIMPNVVYQRSLSKAAEAVKSGGGIGKYLATQPKLIPLMFSQMIDMSEAAGSLDATLQYLSEYYEAEVDEATKTLISVLEPMLMVVMGGMVGFISISIILPIYSISQNIIH